MSVIGTFTKNENGFSGQIKTPTGDTKISILPAEMVGEHMPDFKVNAGSIEIGAGWMNISKNGYEYIFIKIDDPSFEIQSQLIWLIPKESMS